ncbi:MAG TPA: DinB family protein [Vicinamibacterales bacterium]|nr:DinB family protein [Vicinamibacterales bacterium]
MRMLCLALTLLLAIAVPAAEAQISDLERQRLVAHMQMTSAWLEDELASLSPAQAAFRPAPGAWSILDVLDHLVVVGPIYWKNLQEATSTRTSRVGMMNDVDVLWYGIDRTNRETALVTEEPSKKIADVAAGLKAYRADHARLLQYVRTTKDDLRRRLVARQQSDAYQWALLISTHEQRHILQIREIKTHASYPKQ